MECDEGSEALGTRHYSPVWTWRELVLSILAGQMLSMLNASTNIFLTMLARNEIHVSLFPNELVYHGLLILSIWRIRRVYALVVEKKLFWAGLMATSDVAANITVMMAFESTSPVSVMVIVSSSSLFAMLFSMIAFRRRYFLFPHGVSACIVVIGICLINYAKWVDGRKHQDGGEADLVLVSGAVLALIAAVCYALSNVLQEKISLGESGYPWSTLGAMGIGGSVISLVLTQFTAYGISDRDRLIHHPLPSKFWVVGYICAMISMYACVPLYLQRWGAIRLNFSMLTADMYVLIFNLAVPFSQSGSMGLIQDAFYLCGFFGVLAGLFVFNLRQPEDRGVPSALGVPEEPEGIHHRICI